MKLPVKLRPFRQHSGNGTRGGALAGCALTERRQSDRRHRTGDLKQRELRLRSAARIAGFGVFDLDYVSGQTYWSSELRRMAGLPEKGGELTLHSLTERAHPDDRARIEERMRDALDPAGDGRFEEEYRLLRPDGAVCWVKIKGRACFAGQGASRRALAVSGLATDVTAHKEMLLEQERNQARLAAILDSLSEGVVIFDLDGQVLNMNPAAINCLRCRDMSEARLKLPEFTSFFELFSLDGQAVPLEEWPLGRVIRGESFADYELEVHRKDDGKSSILSYNGTLVRGADGKPMLGVLTFRDISDRRQAERALRDKQQRLAGLVGAAMDAIISIDMEQRIVLFNQAAESQFRCSAAEAIGSPIERFIPERFHASHRDQVNRFFTEGVTSRKMGKLQTLWGRRADGEEFPIEASISKGAVGDGWLATVILRDITERFRAEQALHESREQLALALQAGRSGAFDWDAHSNENHWSDELLALYGLRRDEFHGTIEDWLDTLHPDDRDAGLQAVRQSLRDGVFNFEFRIRRRDTGEIRWMQGRGEVIFDSDGRARRMIGVNMDITEKKRLETALQQMNETLERRVDERTAALARANEELLKSNDELQRFAYVASHDLQTPLRTITSVAQLLQRDYRGRLDDHADHLIQRIVTATHRMRTLIQDLLTYSRIDSQALPFQPVDFRQIFQTVLSTLEGTLQETGAQVTCEPLPVVLGDPSQLTQLLQNLIENGIKYHGPQTPRVRVSAHPVNDVWCFSVRDNGIGIPAEQHESIFEIFRRLHTQQAYPGTGIGLAVCRRVVERHGGRIWVESAPGAGSVFHFTLPKPASEAMP